MSRLMRAVCIIVVLIIVGINFIILNSPGCPPEPTVSPISVSSTLEPIPSIEPQISLHIEETPEPTPNPQYGFTEDDIYLLAQLLCGSSEIEGDGEYDFVWGAKYTEMNYAEMCKVLCVVMNRVRSDIYPNTVEEVIMQPYQFIVMPNNLYTTPDDIAIEKIQEWCEAYDAFDSGTQTIPKDHLSFSGDGYTNTTRP